MDTIIISIPVQQIAGNFEGDEFQFARYPHKFFPQNAHFY